MIYVVEINYKIAAPSRTAYEWLNMFAFMTFIILDSILRCSILHFHSSVHFHMDSIVHFHNCSIVRFPGRPILRIPSRSTDLKLLE